MERPHQPRSCGARNSEAMESRSGPSSSIRCQTYSTRRCRSSSSRRSSRPWWTLRSTPTRCSRSVPTVPRSSPSILPWPKHVWLGVSVENADYVDRIDHLRRTPAAVKFLSLEPLLGPLDGLNLKGIDWAIAGGESGPGARPMPSRVGPLDPRSVCRGQGRVSLQAMGRCEQEAYRPRARRQNVGSASETVCRSPRRTWHLQTDCSAGLVKKVLRLGSD